MENELEFGCWLIEFIGQKLEEEARRLGEMNNPLETSPIKEPPLDVEEQEEARISATVASAEDVNQPGDEQPLEPEKEKPKTGKSNHNPVPPTPKTPSRKRTRTTPTIGTRKGPGGPKRSPRRTREERRHTLSITSS